MSALIGCFFFRLTDYGNLIGEFSNNCSSRPQTESADRLEDATVSAGFIGVFRSTWQEEAGDPPLSARLIIDPKPATTGIYTLHWVPEAPSTTHFHGEAMVVEKLLIGWYRIGRPPILKIRTSK